MFPVIILFLSPLLTQELPNFRTPEGAPGQCMKSRCMGSRAGSSPTGKGKSIVNSRPDKNNSASQSLIP